MINHLTFKGQALLYFFAGKPCKDILKKNSTPPSGIYSYRDIDGRDVEIFCDFRGDYGYTFFPPQSLLNLSSLLPHYTTRSEAIIRHFRSDGSQLEATVKMLSRYENQYNLTFLLNSDFNKASNFDEPYLTLGFVPLSFGNRKDTKQGYQVEGHDIEYTNNDGNERSSISFFQTPLISKSCCSNNVKSAWYDYAVPVEQGHELPVEYSFKFSVRFGGWGAAWSYDDPSTGVIGAALGLKYTLDD